MGWSHMNKAECKASKIHELDPLSPIRKQKSFSMGNSNKEKEVNKVEKVIR